MQKPKPSGKDSHASHHMAATYHGWMDMDTAEGIDIREIIRGLSNQCRYNGHTHRPLSIAQHSCVCHQWAKADGLGPAMRRAALLHDAAEAYCGDLPRPVRRAIGEDYDEVIGRVDERIARIYKYPHPLPERVKTIDHLSYIAERHGLSEHPDIDTEGLEVPDSVTELMTGFWTPAQSYDRFARRVIEEVEPSGIRPGELTGAAKDTYAHFISEDTSTS